MARCSTCSKACACSVIQDGNQILQVSSNAILFTSEFLESPRVGRRSTVVVGNGSLQSPFRISFIDSLQYRPLAFEYKIPGPIPLTGDTLFDSSTLVYSQVVDGQRLDTPLQPGSEFADDTVNLTSTESIVVGASVTLNSAGVSKEVTLFVLWDPTDADTGPTLVAADSTEMATSNPALNATGFISPLRGRSVFSAGLNGELLIGVDVHEGFAGVTASNWRIWGILT